MFLVWVDIHIIWQELSNNDLIEEIDLVGGEVSGTIIPELNSQIKIVSKIYVPQHLDLNIVFSPTKVNDLILSLFHYVVVTIMVVEVRVFVVKSRTKIEPNWTT